MSRRIAELIYRFRFPLCGVILAGFVALLPLTNVTEIDNDISMWIAKDDPVYVTYERFREEFGGQRSLLIALRSDRLFTPEGLEFVRRVTDEIGRVNTVERVQSLSTVNIVTATTDEVRLKADTTTADTAGAVRLKADTTGADTTKADTTDDDEGGLRVEPLLEGAIDADRKSVV